MTPGSCLDNAVGIPDIAAAAVAAWRMQPVGNNAVASCDRPAAVDTPAAAEIADMLVVEVAVVVFAVVVAVEVVAFGRMKVTMIWSWS